MRTPTLPLGRWAPWILAVAAVFLVGWGLWSGEREGLVLGGIAGLAWLVAFPLARLVIGDDEDQ